MAEGDDGTGGSPRREDRATEGWLTPEGLQRMITASVAAALRGSHTHDPSAPAGASEPTGTSTSGKSLYIVAGSRRKAGR